MNRSSVLARLVAVGAAVLLAAASLVAVATPASADDPGPTLVECPGTIALSYSPGITSTPRTTSYVGQATLGPCVSTLGPDFASGQLEASGGGELSCLTGGNSTGDASIAWAGGQESEFTFTGEVGLRPLGVTVLILTGTMTDGAFEGADLVVVLPMLATDLLNCLTPTGLTSLAGPISVTITP